MSSGQGWTFIRQCCIESYKMSVQKKRTEMDNFWDKCPVQDIVFWASNSLISVPQNSLVLQPNSLTSAKRYRYECHMTTPPVYLKTKTCFPYGSRSLCFYEKKLAGVLSRLLPRQGPQAPISNLPRPRCPEGHWRPRDFGPRILGPLPSTPPVYIIPSTFISHPNLFSSITSLTACLHFIRIVCPTR